MTSGEDRDSGMDSPVLDDTSAKKRSLKDDDDDDVSFHNKFNF